MDIITLLVRKWNSLFLSDKKTGAAALCGTRSVWFCQASDEIVVPV